MQDAKGPPNYARSWFEEWRSLDEFEQGVDSSSPASDEYRAQQFKFWREAWIASQFSRRVASAAAKLRLAPDSAEWGDFVIRDENGDSVYEIVEALDPAMPPALKRNAAEGKHIYRETEKAASGEMALATIPTLIAQKAGKHYPDGISLVIYVNLWIYLSHDELSQLVPEVGHRFRSIWILNAGTALKIFPVT